MDDKWIVVSISFFAALLFYFVYNNSIGKNSLLDYSVFLGGLFCILVVSSIVYLIFRLKNKEVEDAI